MIEQPIITKITKQKCIGYRQDVKGFVSIIQSEGIATDGKRYQWLRDSWCDKDGYFRVGTDYRYTLLDQSEES